MKLIRLVFTFNRETLRFIVIDKEIFYSDKIWKNWVRVVPKDARVIREILNSRNKIPAVIAKMFNLTKEEQKQYDNSDNEDEIADIIINDAKRNGCKLELKSVTNSEE